MDTLDSNFVEKVASQVSQQIGMDIASTIIAIVCFCGCCYLGFRMGVTYGDFTKAKEEKEKNVHEEE